MEPMVFLMAVLAAIVYAIFSYAKSATTEDVDWEKRAATMVLGLLIGIVLAILICQ